MGSIKQPLSGSSEFDSDRYPPFPAETQPCAKLQTFSLAAVQAGDQSVLARLLAVCKDQGFFYLDVSSTTVQHLPDDAEAIGRLSQDFFLGLSLEEKKGYAWGQKPYSLLGYKHAGFAKADHSSSKRDNVEFMNCGRDDILETPGRFPLELPALVKTPQNRSLFARFSTQAHNTGLVLLSALATQLGLPADAFNEMHRTDRPSDTHTRLIRGPPRITDDDVDIHSPGHTDFGTITLLFNWLGGLQIWSESSHGETFDNFVGSRPEDKHSGGQWLWVKPRPGHVIVNLGDITVKSTGGILCAGRHRVQSAPGVQGQYPRYSVVYLMRPADDHIPRRFKGDVIPPLKEGETEELLTSTQWAAKQTAQLQTGKDKVES